MATTSTILSVDIDKEDFNSDGNYIVETPAGIVGGNNYHVIFADGSKQTITWDGVGREQSFTFDRPVKSFEIDPQHKLLIEVDWTDNALVSP